MAYVWWVSSSGQSGSGVGRVLAAGRRRRKWRGSFCMPAERRQLLWRAELDRVRGFRCLFPFPALCFRVRLLRLFCRRCTAPPCVWYTDAPPVCCAKFQGLGELTCTSHRTVDRPVRTGAKIYTSPPIMHRLERELNKLWDGSTVWLAHRYLCAF